MAENEMDYRIIEKIIFEQQKQIKELEHKIVTPRKKMALIFTGLHYYECYKKKKKRASIRTFVDIDYRCYIRNINEKIIDYFKEKFVIDIYICTNNSIYLEEFISCYKPVSYIIQDSNTRIKKTNAGLTLVNPKKYDMIFLTRPDIYIEDNFNNIQYNKMNIVSQLENHNFIDDNIHIFPSNMFEKFKKAIANLEPDDFLAMHSLKIKNIFGKENINYLKNEQTLVAYLSFFRIRFFEDNKEFIINKYLFTENVSYYYESSEIVISSNKVTLTSSSDCKGAYISYISTGKGVYSLSFNITTNVDIPADYNILRLINEETTFSLSHIKEEEQTKICILINLMNDNEEVRLDFTKLNILTDKDIRVCISDVILSQNIRCQKPECNYVINENKRNNGGTHCCHSCKNKNDEHGKNCKKQVYIDYLPISEGIKSAEKIM